MTNKDEEPKVPDTKLLSIHIEDEKTTLMTVSFYGTQEDINRLITQTAEVIIYRHDHRDEQYRLDPEMLGRLLS